MPVEFEETFTESMEDIGADMWENNSAIEAIVGSRITGEIRIKPPKFANNKGSGKRLKSNKEKAIEKSKKKSRACATCGGRGHNSRTCIENKTDFYD
nr:protein FAR1-RELATED SEQUENCE 5-like [Ipomoea batatas]